MNRSYALGLNEVETRKEVLGQVETAKERVTELLQDSSRRARSGGSVGRQMDGGMVCSTIVAVVANLIAALTNSDRQQTQALAAQLISSAPLPCSSAEREELSTNLGELEQEQQEEQEAILELENQLDALVVSIG